MGQILNRIRAAGAAIVIGMAIGNGAAATAVPDEPRKLWQFASDLCNDGRWDEALPVHQDLTRRHPDYAFGWMGLGWSLHHTGKWQEAIPVYLKALELGAMPPYRIHLELARVQVALGNKEAALQWLERAVAAQAPNRQRLQSDAQLAALHADPRFKALALNIDVTGMTREAGWRADIELAAAEIKRLHYRPFRTVSEAEFDRAIAGLKQEVDKLDDLAVTVRFMQVLNLIADGHTQLVPPFRFSANPQLVPMRMEIFDEGVYVIDVEPGSEALLWARVTHIDGKPVKQAIDAVATIISRDNTHWIKARAPLFIRFPQFLKPLGITRHADRMTFGFMGRDGKPMQREYSLAKRPEKWVSVPPGHTLPAWRRDVENSFWFEHRPADRLVYFQFNAVHDKPDGGETLDAFGQRLVAFISKNDVDRLVIDLRHNGGGNLDLFEGFMRRLLALDKVNRPGGLFVITSRQTFSAAQVFAGHLARFSHATFVGEPTGSSPNFIGEVTEVRLPYSKHVLVISNLYWQTARAQDHRTWIAPHLPTPHRFADLAAGNDPALAAILAYRP